MRGSGEDRERRAAEVARRAPLTKDQMRQVVETILLQEREQGSDLSPTELHSRLGESYPEIAAMELPKFSGGIVRPVKQRLNAEDARREAEAEIERRLLGGGPEVIRERLRRLLFDFGSQFVHTERTQERIELLGESVEGHVERFCKDLRIC